MTVSRNSPAARPGITRMRRAAAGGHPVPAHDLLDDLSRIARQASMTHAGGRTVRRLARQGYIEPSGCADDMPRLTDKARRVLAAAGLEGAAGHAAGLADVEVEDADGICARVLRNEAESPLAWLRRRKGPDGRPMLDDAAFAAGERFRRDFTRAAVMPRTTANWDISAAAGGARGPASATDAMVAARQLFEAACRAVGAELAGLLIDVCGFLKGLEQVERERGWPARSAKVVLLVALGRLAEHYGYRGETRGPARSLGIRAWTARDS